MRAIASLDSMRFLRAFAATPLRTASLVPSSRALAELMVSEIRPAHAPVLELGPGTGVFTRALIARGVPPERIALVEADPGFAALLAIRYPEARLLEMDAGGLRHLAPFDGRAGGAAISGLPLLSMPPHRVLAILVGVFRNLRPGGALYQFTYGPRCPVPRPVMDRLRLRAVRVGHVMNNLPPATVYRITPRRAGTGM